MNKKFKYSKVHGSMQRVIMKMKINHLSIQSTFYKREESSNLNDMNIERINTIVYYFLPTDFIIFRNPYLKLHLRAYNMGRCICYTWFGSAETKFIYS